MAEYDLTDDDGALLPTLDSGRSGMSTVAQFADIGKRLDAYQWLPPKPRRPKFRVNAAPVEHHVVHEQLEHM